MKQKDILSMYLNQYQSKKIRKEILCRRLEAIRADMNPLRGIDYSAFSVGKSGNIPDMPASFCIKCDELLDDIEKERREASSAMIRVHDIIKLLDKDSTERTVLELKYIDGYKWDDMRDVVFCSRSTCINYWNEGLKKLLEFGKVHAIVLDYSKKNDLEIEREK